MRKGKSVRKSWIKFYEGEGVGKARKYYSITKEGKKYLKAKLEEWETYSAAVADVLAFVV